MIKRIIADYIRRKEMLEDKIKACKEAIGRGTSNDMVLFATEEKRKAEKKLADTELKLEYLKGLEGMDI